MVVFIRISFAQWHTHFNRISAPEKLNSAYATPFLRFGLCVAALWCCAARWMCTCAFCLYMLHVLMHWQREYELGRGGFFLELVYAPSTRSFCVCASVLIKIE